WHPLVSLPRRPPPTPTLFPYTTLFRSISNVREQKKSLLSLKLKEGKSNSSGSIAGGEGGPEDSDSKDDTNNKKERHHHAKEKKRSEEHTSELQSRENLVCRLLLEKKKR